MKEETANSEIDKLIEASSHLAGIAIEPSARANVCANLATVLSLAETIDDVGHEAAPIFRA